MIVEMELNSANCDQRAGVHNKHIDEVKGNANTCKRNIAADKQIHKVSKYCNKKIL